MKENEEELQYPTNKQTNKQVRTKILPNQPNEKHKQNDPKTPSLKKPEWPISPDFSTEEGFWN